MPDATVRFLAAEPGPQATENGMLSLVAEGRLADHPHPDIVLVPGGFGTRALMEDEAMLDWVREAHAGSDWTTSVCTGALVLAAAGILDGVPATTHWLLRDRLRELGAVPVEERVVRHGKIVTAAGVSAGIDMALTLAGRDRRRDVRRGDPARDRVRPGAAVPRRQHADRSARGHRARQRSGRRELA